MKNLYKAFLLLGIFICASNLYAQNMSDMRLNEVLVTNNQGFEDDYGCRSGWIELFNTSYGTVDIAGCYLSTDPNNLTMYRIPKGDVLTKIAPRQHILFWADGLADRGTFHLGFTLDGVNKIIFTAADGRTVIDEVELPALEPDESYGRKNDGIGTSKEQGVVYKSFRNTKLAEEAKADKATKFGWVKMDNPTPSTNNATMSGESKSAMMARTDPHGLFLTLTAMCVTFLALAVLFFVFKQIGKYHIRKKSENAVKSFEGTAQKSKADTSGQVSAETYAAISMAIHMFMVENEAHDFEDTVLTINKVSKSYSPWSSKIYTLRETPQLRK